MSRPNILLITTDEQHLRTLSCYGTKTETTPSIDALAERADVYDHAYTISPVCLPARCSIMTGLYPHNSGSVSNIFGASLSTQLPNLFTELKKVGYRTSLHGKCHFIPVPYPATRPNMTLEYEHFISYYRSLGMDTLDLQDDKNNSLWYYDDYAKELARKDMLKTCRREAHMTPSNQGCYDFPFESDMHPDAWVGNRAIEHINSASECEPNFIWVSFSGPHYPIDTPKEYTERIDPEKMDARIYRDGEWDDESKYHRRGFHGPGTTEGSGSAKDHAQKNYSEEYWQSWRRRYLGNIALIDEKVGEIIDAARAKFGDDLFIIYTTDHGEMMGNHSLWGKNGSLFEDVLRIPLIIQKPGQRSGKRIEETVSSIDIFPTVLSAAGITDLPKCDGKPIDETVSCGGLDFIISECEDRVAIIKDKIKLEINRVSLKPRPDEMTGKVFYELYDLEKDPYEFENRYSDPEYADKIKELTSIIEGHPYLTETIFRDFTTGEDYWLNDGKGAGLANR
ncbi:MAG: sulfatase-like hydrolase/transferase [Clostridia bacterium]|nr:sulfatase-like hydrolase/transferase [Clostridia bacterium]